MEGKIAKPRNLDKRRIPSTTVENPLQNRLICKSKANITMGKIDVTLLTKKTYDRNTNKEQ